MSFSPTQLSADILTCFRRRNTTAGYHYAFTGKKSLEIDCSVATH